MERLTLKTVTLVAISTAHRLQTISKIKLNNIVKLDDRLEIMILDVLKSSRVSLNQPKLIIPVFPANSELCVASTLNFYVQKTKPRREAKQTLFITHRRPFRAATTQTLSRWIKKTMEMGGIDTTLFSSYSTRHASSSAAFRSGVNIETLRANVGWSKDSDTFFKFYNRPISNSLAFSKGIFTQN